MNERVYSERYFGMQLEEMRLKQCRTSEARYWDGIRLSESFADKN
jgi:hypothetical protein